MTVKYSRFRHNAKQASFTSTGPRRQGDEHEHAQYPTNDDVTSGWSCRRPENVSILSSVLSFRRLRLFKPGRKEALLQTRVMSRATEKIATQSRLLVELRNWPSLTFLPHSLIEKSNFAMGKSTRGTKNEPLGYKYLLLCVSKLEVFAQLLLALTMKIPELRWCLNNLQ